MNSLCNIFIPAHSHPAQYTLQNLTTSIYSLYLPWTAGSTYFNTWIPSDAHGEYRCDWFELGCNQASKSTTLGDCLEMVIVDREVCAFSDFLVFGLQLNSSHLNNKKKSSPDCPVSEFKRLLTIQYYFIVLVAAPILPRLITYFTYFCFI